MQVAVARQALDRGHLMTLAADREGQAREHPAAVDPYLQAPQVP